MTDINAIIAGIRADGGKIWAENGNLRLQIPSSKNSDARMASLREHKAELIQALTIAELDSSAVLDAWRDACTSVASQWEQLHRRCGECPAPSGGHAAFWTLEKRLWGEIYDAWQAGNWRRAILDCDIYRTALIAAIPKNQDVGISAVATVSRDNARTDDSADAPWIGADGATHIRQSSRTDSSDASGRQSDDRDNAALAYIRSHAVKYGAPEGPAGNRKCRECDHMTGSYTRIWCACCLEKRHGLAWILEGALCGGGRVYDGKSVWR